MNCKAILVRPSKLLPDGVLLEVLGQKNLHGGNWSVGVHVAASEQGIGPRLVGSYTPLSQLRQKEGFSTPQSLVKCWIYLALAQ